MDRGGSAWAQVGVAVAVPVPDTRAEATMAIGIKEFVQ